MNYSHTPIYKQSRKRKPKKALLISIVAIFFTLLLLYLTTSDRAREPKPFFQHSETPLVIAHRGGSTFPENTLEAFHHSEQIGADIIEFDIHMTKDGHLVVIHDSTVDRTTDGSGEIAEFTLAELKQLDAGYYFTDEEGNYPYRNFGITIPTVEEVFEAFSHMPMNIETKAQYPLEGPSQIEEKLMNLIQKYEIEDKVLLASFDQKIIDHFNSISGGKVAISGGQSEVTKFVLLHKFFTSFFYKSKVDAIQMPTEANIFNLKDQKLIRGASKLNMQTHYWTINDKEEMIELLKLGADGIITDKPELLIETIQELGLK